MNLFRTNGRDGAKAFMTAACLNHSASSFMQLNVGPELELEFEFAGVKYSATAV